MDVAYDLRLSHPGQRTLVKWQYDIVSENLYQLDLGEYHTYGIQLVTPDTMDILHDVSVDEETARYVVEILNHFQVAPVHLYDVVVDTLP